MGSRSLLRLVFLGLAVFAACHKGQPGNKNSIPHASEVGAEMMACYLDSIPWVIQQANSNLYEFQAGEGLNDTFAIGGYPQPGISSFRSIQQMELILFGLINVGVPYAANDSEHVIFWYSPDSTCQGFNTRETPTFTACSGTVTLTKYDYRSRVISGIFNAKFAIPGCDTVTISQGWFDFKF